MTYSYSIRNITYRFNDLKDLLAKASPPRSGDYLAGVAAGSTVERMAAKMCLADLPLPAFLSEAVIPYEADEVTRLIIDRHDAGAFADQDDMDTLLTLLGAAGVTFIMGVPGADDIMLNYQSTSFHDALYLRTLLGLKRAPEFEAWLEKMQITNPQGQLREITSQHGVLRAIADLTRRASS
jgi:ethanolamine ammonia-lyase large subunit